MTKDDPPRAFLPPKYGGDPKSNRHEFVATADLGSVPLDLDDVSQVRRRVLGDALKASGLAVPDIGGSPFHCRGGLFQPLGLAAAAAGFAFSRGGRCFEAAPADGRGTVNVADDDATLLIRLKVPRRCVSPY
jgi:hypothetical protein